MSTWRVEVGDCVEVLAAMPEASIDAVVCDPPYHLAFMGKAWDTITPGQSQHEHERWAREALRVLKPGGHLLAFGGTRTYHRLTAGIEDAGFEIRDTIAWMYGSGFPKSLDVSKAIDKAAGAQREIVGEGPNASRRPNPIRTGTAFSDDAHVWGDGDPITAPATPDAERWEGWGTALKPAFEPIVVARKPLAGTVSANVLEHGTGALNITGCRVDVDDQDYARNHSGDRGHNGTRSIEDRGATDLRPGGGSASEVGRWPANVVLDEDAGVMLDEQTGELSSGANPTRRGSNKFAATYGDFIGQEECEPARGADSGGASRFFYCAKAGSGERNAGLGELPELRKPTWSSGEANPGTFQSDGTTETARNVHPTVKPIDLMRWLVRLVTPPDGTVLDPFTGSGTTGCAAVLEDFDFIGVEREQEYAELAKARIAFWSSQPAGVTVDEAVAGDVARQRVAESGQGALDLFG